MRRNSVLKVTAAALLGGALLVGGVDGAGDPVFAQGNSGSAGNGGGGNSGGGNGNAGGGSRGASSDAGGGRGASGSARGGAESRGQGAETRGGGADRPETGRPDHAGPPEDMPLGAQLSDDAQQGLGKGSLASRMGALNAAHASEQALANAAPNSRVGRIAAYRDAVLAGEETSAELAETQALLSALDDPEAAVRTILQGGEIGSPELEAKVREVAELREAVGEGEATEEELNTALGELRTLYNAVYAETASREEELSGVLEDSAAEAQRLLEDAANKPVDAEVVAEVNTLLGLPEDPLGGLLLELYATDEDAAATE